MERKKHLLRLFQTTLKRIYQRLRNGLLCKVLLALRCPLCNCSTKTHGRPSLLTVRKFTVYTMDPTLLKFEAERKNGTGFRIILFCQGSLKVFALQVKGKLKVLLHFLRPSPENNASQWSRFQFDCCANNTIASMRKERIPFLHDNLFHIFAPNHKSPSQINHWHWVFPVGMMF